MIHWQKVLKPIRESGTEGITREAIAEKIMEEPASQELAGTIQHLLENGKIIAAIGDNKKGGVALIFQLPQPRRSRREDIKFDPEIDEIFDPPEKTETINTGETPQRNVSPSHRSEKTTQNEVTPLPENELKKEPQ